MNHDARPHSSRETSVPEALRVLLATPLRKDLNIREHPSDPDTFRIRRFPPQVRQALKRKAASQPPTPTVRDLKCKFRTEERAERRMQAYLYQGAMKIAKTALPWEAQANCHLPPLHLVLKEVATRWKLAEEITEASALSIVEDAIRALAVGVTDETERASVRE